jgi:FkbM family methyltransferase
MIMRVTLTESIELVRRSVRRALGAHSNVYRCGAKTFEFFAVVWKEGVLTWLQLKKLGSSARVEPNGAVEPIKLKSLQFPIFVRPRAEDVLTITDNVVRAEYGNFSPASEPKWMLDAGAFIGDTAAYFLSRFPGLRVIALEPDPANFAVAQINLRPYGERVFLINQGLFGIEESFSLRGSGTGGALDMIGGPIKCTTIRKILDDYGIPNIDILKMDIEGAESSVFAESPESWLGNVSNLIIELHGPERTRFVHKVLADHGFSVRQYRSLWYCSRSSNCYSLRR